MYDTTRNMNQKTRQIFVEVVHFKIVAKVSYASPRSLLMEKAAMQEAVLLID
jgi:hypothetical protein